MNVLKNKLGLQRHFSEKIEDFISKFNSPFILKNEKKILELESFRKPLNKLFYSSIMNKLIETYIRFDRTYKILLLCLSRRDINTIASFTSLSLTEKLKGQLIEIDKSGFRIELLNRNAPINIYPMFGIHSFATNSNCNQNRIIKLPILSPIIVKDFEAINYNYSIYCRIESELKLNLLDKDNRTLIDKDNILKKEIHYFCAKMYFRKQSDLKNKSLLKIKEYIYPWKRRQIKRVELFDIDGNWLQKAIQK